MFGMTKENAIEILIRTVERFNSVSKESVGVCYTWNGDIKVLGSESFRNYIAERKDDVCQSLAYTQTANCITNTAVNRDLMSLLEQDVRKLSVVSLRRLISWIVRNHTGKSRHFWGKSEFKPSWWPEYIPFRSVSKNYTKHTLMVIISAYKKFNRNGEQSPPTNRDMLHTTITHEQSLMKDIIIKQEGGYDSSSPLSTPKSYQDNILHLGDALLDESNDSIYSELQI